MNGQEISLKELDKNTWEIEEFGKMNVPGRLFVDRDSAKGLLAEYRQEDQWSSLEQLINVASLPGIVSASIGLADIHPGYGFPIGGVGAFDVEDGVVVAGGVGFDINCGVRLLRTPLEVRDVTKVKDKLADALYRTVPAGLGSEGEINLSIEEIDKALVQGARFGLEIGYGIEDDLEYVEENGRIDGADPKNVSRRAKQRQFKQVGTLGSGNHYLEVQEVEEIYDREAGDAYGLHEGQIVISIHTGSRALGHQIGQDYLSKLKDASKKYDLPIEERELVSAPIDSPEGREYLSAMRCGMNCAFANRQVLAGLARRGFSRVVDIPPKEIRTVYEVGHNTAKVEDHTVNGVQQRLLVHRKGATRAFGPGREELPEAYRGVGGPVLVGGTMGSSSYVLRGTETAMKMTFGSGIHGAGRAMSRKKAKSKFWGEDVETSLRSRGIVVKSHSYPGLAEEAPGAYKDVDRVVDSVDTNGLTPKVAKLKPIIVVKG
ncbi:MAG: RtcB family protein [Candidatus Bipolaricaulota bacterium]